MTEKDPYQAPSDGPLQQDEVDLTRQLIVLASERETPLSQDEVDALLGLEPHKPF